MVSTTPMSKRIRSSFCRVARGSRFATLALLVACACLGPRPHCVVAAEISAESGVKQPGFADIVAKVKPAVIAVMVRLESDAQVSDTDDPEVPSQSQPFAENSPLHRYFFGSPKQQPQPPPAWQIKVALGSGFFYIFRWVCGDERSRRPARRVFSDSD